MTEKDREQVADLVIDLQNEAEDILTYSSSEAAKSAVVTAARILAILEGVE